MERKRQIKRIPPKIVAITRSRRTSTARAKSSDSRPEPQPLFGPHVRSGSIGDEMPERDGKVKRSEKNLSQP